ncbi:zinc-binding alcohol dehydrogenase family protein [Kribbella sp. NPDC004536]|uniref:quinone oxidoreductase family protein n=1 Tax=Kribbella sp. NPDC004536 TaxID=3364106 RepID=UPI0036A9EF70
MRRVWYGEHGGPEVLQVEEVDVPSPGPGEVLLEVDAVGVTLPGLFHLRDLELPQRPGGELAGRVVAVGDGVEGFAVGQRVAGLTMSGAMADYAVAPAALLDVVPEDVPPVIAMALLRSGQVALAALELARLQPGDSVLVTAAAGGVGHLAVQLAKSLGAGRVVGTVSDASKAEFVRRQGADEVVLSNEARWPVEVDVVVEGVGGVVLERALQCVKPFGRLITLSAAPGRLASHDLLTGLRTVTGLSMGQVARNRPDLIGTWRRQLWTLLATGQVRPAIAAELSLEEAAKAYQLLADRANQGKVTLVP